MTSYVPPSRWSWIGGLLLAACSGARSTPSLGDAHAVERPRPVTAQERKVARPGDDPRSTSRTDETTLVAVDDGLRIELPRDPDFLATPLPPQHPERYQSFRETSRIQVGQSHLQQIDLFPGDDSLLAVSEAEGTVRVYERRTKRLVGNHAIDGLQRFAAGGVVAWPEGEPRFLAGTPRGLVLVAARSGAELARFDGRALGALRWSPDRRILIAGAHPSAGQHALHLFVRRPPAGDDALRPRLEPLGTVTFGERVDGWGLSADNRLLASSLYPSGDLLVVDLQAGGVLLRIPAPRYAGDVAFSPDGRWVAIGGQGLLLVDLLDPARRAFYSHLYNNIDHVRFSPDGSALVASSYDGHVRIFDYRCDAQGRPRLSLVHALRHAGRANVYGFVFEADGAGIVSTSGDQTVRTFRGSPLGDASGAPTRTFLDLAEWRRVDPEGARPLPPAPAPRLVDGHYHPAALDGPPRPSRIRPGRYACKIELMYKLRDCWVRTNAAGHTLLEFAPDNLLDLAGVLYDDGSVVRFEGWLRTPSTVVGCRGCENQPLHAVFRGGGKSWRGLLQFRNYYDPHVPPEAPAADAPIESADDRFPLVLEFRGALPAPQPGGDET